MKTLKIIYALLLISAFSCNTNNEEPSQLKNLGLEDLSFEGLNLNMTTVISLKEMTLEEITAEVAKELYNYDNNINANARTTSDIGLIGVDMIIYSDRVQITPIEGAIGENGDDEDCGGKKGDGWKSYGKCYSEPCVKNKLAEAGRELGEKVGSGQCMDLRVRKSALNARVCGRIINC